MLMLDGGVLQLLLKMYQRRSLSHRGWKGIPNTWNRYDARKKTEFQTIASTRVLKKFMFMIRSSTAVGRSEVSIWWDVNFIINYFVQ